jgi:hypothetical protein
VCNPCSAHPQATAIERAVVRLLTIASAAAIAFRIVVGGIDGHVQPTAVIGLDVAATAADLRRSNRSEPGGRPQAKSHRDRRASSAFLWRHDRPQRKV